MGLLTTDIGHFDLTIVETINPEFVRQLSTGSLPSVQSSEQFVEEAYLHFSKMIHRYSDVISDVQELDQSSWGVPIGHEGLNDFFLSVCEEASSKENLRREIEQALLKLKS